MHPDRLQTVRRGAGVPDRAATQDFERNAFPLGRQGRFAGGSGVERLNTSAALYSSRALLENECRFPAEGVRAYNLCWRPKPEHHLDLGAALG